MSTSIYAYAVGIRSSRKMTQALVEDIAFRVVADDRTPGPWALDRFGTRHREALAHPLARTVPRRVRTRGIDAPLGACDVQDERDDETYGPDGDGICLPEESRSMQARRNATAAANQELERRAKDRNVRSHEKHREAATNRRRGDHPRDDAEDAHPRETDQVDSTDPEARTMTGHDAFIQAINGRVAVDRRRRRRSTLRRVA